MEEDTPFTEIESIGKRITIGDVVLEVNERCKRCSMINIDPLEFEKAPICICR